MRFYRGIAVPAASKRDVIHRIRSRGLITGEGVWTMKADDLKPRLEELWQLPVVSFDAMPSAAETPDWVCACADEAGASYYACRHNRSMEKDTPILITFEAEPADAVVDGRDFLFTLFQRGHPTKGRPVAERLFGPRIL